MSESVKSTADEIQALRACISTMAHILHAERYGCLLRPVEAEQWHRILAHDGDEPPRSDDDTFADWLEATIPRVAGPLMERCRLLELRGAPCPAPLHVYTDAQIRAGFQLAYSLGLLDAEAAPVKAAVVGEEGAVGLLSLFGEQT